METADETNSLVPFHKLSQWLAYSLIEPLEWAGYTVTDLDDLTGLPEYRNGGLFLDSGVITLKDPVEAESAQAVDSTLVVEWRALTVALLDLIAEPIREKLGLDAKRFPLAKVLEGGTWADRPPIGQGEAAGRFPSNFCRQRRHRVLIERTDKQNESKRMQGVTVVDHPLVQHKLTLMREKERSTKGFRQLLNEIGMLLCYEVTRDLPIERIEIETPMMKMEGAQIAGKKLVLAPILRAGVGFLDGMLTLVPAARVAHIGLYRDPESLQAVEYYFKAPSDLADRMVLVLDPMLATANSAVRRSTG